MIIRLDEDSAQAGINEAKPGDVLLLEPGESYRALRVGGKRDIRIIGLDDAVYCAGFNIGYCTDVQVDGVTSISESRWPLVISHCERIRADIVTVAQPWPPRARTEFNNAKVCDIADVQGLDLTGAAIGFGRKTLGIYRSSHVDVHNFYARYDGFIKSGVNSIGKCLSPSYHNDHLTLTDVVGETGADAAHTCDLFSSDRHDESMAVTYIDRMLLVNGPGGVKNRYGFGWLRNDQSRGVTVQNLTLDIATGNAVRLDAGPGGNELHTIEMIGVQNSVYDDESSWQVTHGLRAPQLPRLTERLKLRVTEATRRADGPTKVFA